MTTKSNLILNKDQVGQIIRRIAYEIYENNFKEKQLVIAGINGQGYILGDMLAGELRRISPIKVDLVEVEVDKENPSKSEIRLSCGIQKLQKKSIILTDDVLSSGQTMAYSMKPFLESEIKKLETAVLINRSHKRFPISANYKGYELSTTISEHIEVKLKEKKEVYLW
jgi:pyrimidine operon attenuation protein/uracil phosphoribosyltransferase